MIYRKLQVIIMRPDNSRVLRTFHIAPGPRKVFRPEKLEDIAMDLIEKLPRWVHEYKLVNLAPVGHVYRVKLISPGVEHLKEIGARCEDHAGAPSKSCTVCQQLGAADAIEVQASTLPQVQQVKA